MATEPANSGGLLNSTSHENANSGGALNTPQHYDGYAWLVAWGVLIAILTLLNRTRLGHTAIYYGLILTLFFIVVSNYRFISTALAPFHSLP